MPASLSTAKRSVVATALAAVASGGVGVMMLTGPATPPVSAAPDSCAASEVAKTVAMVATHTANYLDANPEADQTLTAISQQQSGPESVAELKTYFDANPQVAGDLQRLQQPLVALSGRCKLPVTLPQVLGLVQAAQQGRLQDATPEPPTTGTAPRQQPVSNTGAGQRPGPAPVPKTS